MLLWDVVVVGVVDVVEAVEVWFYFLLSEELSVL
jgi:hypothetical protein